jgi:hypothetical protein
MPYPISQKLGKSARLSNVIIFSIKSGGEGGIQASVVDGEVRGW